MSSETERPSGSEREASALGRATGAHLIRSALDHLRRGISPDVGTLGETNIARQKADLREWAQGAGLLLTADQLPTTVVRGGQEHDISRNRYFKVTRDGVLGFSPGIELALVSSSQDARRFHLWEATPLEYLERLHLHNQLVPDVNWLEGILSQSDGDLAIVTSQPRFDIVPVTEAEIEGWFSAQGFQRITHSGYYRSEDNLGVFDAHDKNVVRAGDTLVPFDIIPCHPAGGFLEFIADTIAAGHSVRAVRTVSTTPQSSKK